MSKVMTKSNVTELIEKYIRDNDVVLFMKGTADKPFCGFSKVACTILQNLGVNFKDVNVLEDNELRQKIKEYSDWPTIPQLYIKKEFVGGCDIMREMYDSGELEKLLKNRSVIS